MILKTFITPFDGNQNESSNVVIIMVIVIESPYADSIFSELPKNITTNEQATHKNQFTRGMYTCPLMIVG